jgi:hypothetical protein
MTARIKLFLAFVCLVLLPAGLAVRVDAAAAIPAFRPPAVPLVTFDPYMSIWSEADHLTDSSTVYWDGNDQSLISLVRIDGTIYRVMGDQPATTPALPQQSVKVLPTQTIYTFGNAQINLTLTFTTPRLPSSLQDMTLPVTFITWSVSSADGNQHSVQIYYSTSSSVAVNTTDEQVSWSRSSDGTLTALSCGTTTQDYFDVSGDPVGLDWGYIDTAAPAAQCIATVDLSDTCINDFIAGGVVPSAVSTQMPLAVNAGEPVEAISFNLGLVGSAAVSRHVLVAYDEVYAIDYFGVDEPPYWRQEFSTPSAMLQWADANYTTLMQQCSTFDSQVVADAGKLGGYQYATIVSLAYRQALAAMGIAADRNGMPMVYTKEETSNGDIATVDVIAPASPLLLTFCPQLEAASLVPVLNSANTPKWTFPWAPHDLGTYPICTGHYNTGGENMPIEESGNMIIMAAAIAKAEGNADFAAKYWNLFSSWALYLKQSGYDPGLQLSTNDFLGFMAHNANLSVKAIVAMGAYAMLCRMRSEAYLASGNQAQANAFMAEANEYQATAKEWVKDWMAVDNDGTHYRMAFDQPGTWSMLYNLQWDQALGLNLFPMSVRKEESAFYAGELNQYGLPDRSTVTQTKTDFEVWTATMCSSTVFNSIIDDIYNFLDQTPTRVPLADQYGTNTAWGGMHARPVVGAVFMPILNNAAMWKKWAAQGASFSDNWAALPPAPVVNQVVPTAQNAPVIWSYTTATPPANWYATNFDDSSWSSGPAGFGTVDPGVTPRTAWTTSDIWLRRTFTMPAGNYPNLTVYCYHDEDIEVYINGVLAASAPGYSTTYVPLTITPAGLAALHAGQNVMAVHVHQTVGGQFVDVGLAQWYVPNN